MLVPNPEEWPAEGNVIRFFSCKFYYDCLTIAAKEDWFGFDCSACALGKEIIKTNTEQIRKARKENE